MPGKVTPGVIFASRFVFSEKKFSSYINYVDRPAAVRSQAYNQYSVYADYMDNPKKRSPGFNARSDYASALFTATKDQLTQAEKQQLKMLFGKAQKNDSPMWQQAISFTDEFLEKYGLYDRASQSLDEKKIREVTRLAIQEELKDETMVGSAVWSASIHYNTDNIHVHIAIVEPTPTRPKREYAVKDKGGKKIGSKVQFKGSMKPKTFAKVKSKIINNIIDRSVELQKINDIIRKNIVAEKRERNSYRDDRLRGAFLNLYRALPPDKRLWKYNMNALSRVRPEIDNFTRLYIDMFHRKDFVELKMQLKDQQEFLKSVYGTGKHQYYENYEKTKMKDLYTRMGNAVLRELRAFDKSLHTQEKRQWEKKDDRTSSVRPNGMYNLKKALKRDYVHARNLAAFQNLQREIEQENER